MIKITKLKTQLDGCEVTFESGGEMEKYVAGKFYDYMLREFGCVVEIEVEK